MELKNNEVNVISGSTKAAPVVRFAPSPTGHLHIGGVRTALFNYFFARRQAGQYILRIEDTDVSRSSRDMAQEILNGLRWLGIQWDHEPIYQSDRFDMYKKAAFRLLGEKKAYRCFCTPEEIEARKTGQLYKYDRGCFHLTRQEIDEKLARNVPFVIRFFIPEGVTSFKDRLHKEVKIDNSELEDFVILKSDDSPTYHLSVVVDDSDMEITDVIRGDDHISNTFKQVLLFLALGHRPPRYAHLPLILGPDKKKLSKRHGETSVLEFKKNGYLPEAIINYLSQLSWIPADSKTIFTMEELIGQFDLGKVSKSSPVFDYEKLRFLNSRVLQQKSAVELCTLLAEDESSGFNKKYASVDGEKKKALIDLVKPRMKTLQDFERKFDLYIKGDLNYDNDDWVKLKENHSTEDIRKYLKLLIAQLETIDAVDFGGDAVEAALRECAEKNGLKAADLIHPARFALTSEAVSPSIFDVFAFFGKEESIGRMNALIDYLDGKRQ
jgi:glutamyl-tRNA synthetase